MDETVFMKCMGDETRFRVIEFLGEDEKCVCDIIEFLGKEQTLVSHHLKALRDCGIVLTRRDGKKIMYRISDPTIIEVLDKIKEISGRLKSEGVCV
jgi:ArsR family transcriptional regulator